MNNQEEIANALNEIISKSNADPNVEGLVALDDPLGAYISLPDGFVVRGKKIVWEGGNE